MSSDCDKYLDVLKDKGSCYEAYDGMQESITVKNDWEACLKCEIPLMCD